MNKMILRAMLSAIPAAALVACGGSDEGTLDARQSPLAAPTSTTTAQSVMIDASTTPKTLAIVSTETWRYDFAGASALFTNQQVGAPTVTTSTKTSGPTTTTETTDPGVGTCVPTMSATSAPAPDTTKVWDEKGGKNDVVGDNQCNFLDGTALTGTQYTQTTESTGSCVFVESSVLQTKGPDAGKYKVVRKTLTQTDTYSWAYEVAPATASYPAFTAWTLEDSTNPDGTAKVNVKALIAGESVSVSKNLGTKYSFSLLDNAGVPRISNVCVGADGAAGDCTGALDYLDRANTPALNYGYTGNAYKGGLASASLIDSTTSAGVTALDILNGVVGPDTFAGNNNGGTNGQALAAMQLRGLQLGLTAGDHVLNFTATVKDNTGAFVSNVSVTKTVKIITPGCGGGPK